MDDEAAGKQRNAWLKGCFAVAFMSISLFAAFAWWMSPLGFGFAGVSQDPAAQGLYRLSYFVGIPSLLLAQLTGLIVLLLRKPAMAFRISAIALAAFILVVLGASAALGVLF